MCRVSVPDRDRDGGRDSAGAAVRGAHEEVSFVPSAQMCDYRTMSGDAEWADVGERLRAARLAAGLTQEELGGKSGLDRTMIVKIESGKTGA